MRSLEATVEDSRSYGSVSGVLQSETFPSAWFITSVFLSRFFTTLRYFVLFEEMTLWDSNQNKIKVNGWGNQTNEDVNLSGASISKSLRNNVQALLLTKRKLQITNLNVRIIKGTPAMTQENSTGKAYCVSETQAHKMSLPY